MMCGNEAECPAHAPLQLKYKQDSHIQLTRHQDNVVFFKMKVTLSD